MKPPPAAPLCAAPLKSASADIFAGEAALSSPGATPGLGTVGTAPFPINRATSSILFVFSGLPPCQIKREEDESARHRGTRVSLDECPEFGTTMRHGGNDELHDLVGLPRGRLAELLNDELESVGGRIGPLLEVRLGDAREKLEKLVLWGWP